MSEAPSVVERLKERFSTEQQKLPGAQESWVRALRQSSMESFVRLGLPTTRQEAWKYTDVHKYLERLTVTASGQASEVTKEQLAAFTVGTDCHKVVVIDGRFSGDHSDFSALPAGIRIESVADILVQEPHIIEPHLNGHHLAGAFPMLNSAMMRDGVYFELGDGIILDKPVHLLFVSTEAAGPSHIRNLFVAGEQSSATIIEHFVALGESGGFINMASDIELHAGGRIEHYQLQESDKGEANIGSLNVHQHRDSYYHSHSAAFGAALSRRDIHVELNGEGAECLLNGLYLAAGSQHVDHHTRIDHTRPNCRSRESYKGVIGGRARAVFNGKVVVHKGADGTDSAQSNANLLLSDKAEIDTKPDLEIHADDVKCAHGATVGQLDTNQLFYLRSRGLSEAEARNVLMFAFADEVLAAIRVPELRAYLEKRALTKLPHGEELEGVLG